MTVRISARRAEAIRRAQAFDAAARAEAAAPAPASRDEAFARLADVIDALPQRPAIPDETAASWIRRTWSTSEARQRLELGLASDVEPEVGRVHNHVLWHVRRASAIGGSEASTVYQHFEGRPGGFGQDAHNLVLQKLLVIAPSAGTPEMARGVRAEPWLQRMLDADRPGWRRDQQTLDRLRGFRWDLRPGMVGTPDDVMIDPDGRRIILDYKCPSADVIADYDKNGVAFDYVCQLHHYATLCLASRTGFDEMAIEAFDPRSFELKRFAVPFDQALCVTLAKRIDAIWMEHVLSGNVPPALEPAKLAVETSEIRTLAVQAALLKVFGDEVSTRQKELTARIAALGSDWHDLAEGRIELGVASLDRSRAWDEPKLLDLAAAAGVDDAPFWKVDKKLDADAALAYLTALRKEVRAGRDVQGMLADLAQDGPPMVRKLNAPELAAAIQEAGVSTLEAAGIQERFSLTRKKSGPEMEKLAVLRDKSSEMVQAVNEVFTQISPELLDLIQADPEAAMEIEI